MNKLFLFLYILFFSAVVFAVAPTGFRDVYVSGAEHIGGTGAANSKSLLDLTSTTLGLLPPRMTTTQRNAISSPPQGLMVYDITLLSTFYYDGSAWQDTGVPATAIGNLGKFLQSGGGSGSNVWATPGATTGGTGFTTYALGDTLYSDATNSLAKLSGNITTTKKYLSQTGNGSISAAPSWNQPTCADLSNGTTSCSTANASANTASTLVARDGSGNFSAGTISAALTGTASGNTTITAANHGIVISGAANAMTSLARGSANQFLQSGGSSADPAWSTATIPGTATTSDLLYASATNVWSSLAKSNSSALVSNTSGVPQWIAGTVANRVLRTDGFSLTFSQVNLGNDVTSTLPIANGGTGVTSVTTSPSTSNYAGWDSNLNLSSNSFITGFASTATAAATTTLTVSSPQNQVFTGTSTQTLKLPVVTTLINGQQFSVFNNSTGIVTVQSSGSNTITAMIGGSRATFTTVDTTAGTGTASWTANYIPTFDSANTASNAVARDGSGNFSAGTVTAALTGTASGNTTYTAANHGLVVSTATNAMTVLARGTSGQVLLSGGASADPAWSTETIPATGAAGSILNNSSANTGAFTITPVLGVAGASTGTIGLSGVTSGVVTIQPQSAAGTYNFNLPITAGSSGQVLTSAGGAAAPMTWSAALVSPLTTTGDIIMSSDNSGTAVRNVPSALYNFIINSAFDYWQRGTSTTATNVSGATHTLNTTSQVYQPDQWFVSNTLGGGTVNGVITFSQVAAVTNGSGFGASVKITTAPTGTGLQNGAELYQVLSNKASLPLYGQTASFTVLVKALGNVNQIGCQFFYGTTEVKPTNAIGAEATATVNTSTFSSCTISGQALGTSQTAAGVIGVRIRPTAVSSGNLYDLNNGYVVEQAMLNLGTVALPFMRQFQDPAAELRACQYFYEKSYELTTNPGTNTANGQAQITGMFNTATLLGNNGVGPRFLVQKRTSPTITIYAPDGTSGSINYTRQGLAATKVTETTGSPSTMGFSITSSAVTGNTAGQAGEMMFHWVSDASM